ncbi:DUF4328 domain-containing protein [Spongiactinospora sp. TRM90649]|uniref:DUF4328 domain-containing protein n=1 Tax=Spongiactinospora sp. TRM90649 TaxID=3031114 RepID=UPI0023F8AD77|nr:DUF4328 domain-containing protein [Spongiactinospora sp. TRM90649]MDF5758688.1 DUF4328 domain-containing protein [Spongiactinospora sp. TRM90649]
MRVATSPPQRAALAVYTALLAHVVALAALVAFEAIRGERLSRQLALLDAGADSPGRQALVGAVTVFAVLVLAVGATALAAACAYLTWLVRAMRASSPGARRAGGVLVSWLVPVLNLAVPPLLVDRVWRNARRGARRPATGRRRWLILLAAWWASWLGALAVTASGFAGLPGLTGIGFAHFAAFTLAALLCAATVREVSRLQAARFRPRPRRRRAAHGEDRATMGRVIRLRPLNGGRSPQPVAFRARPAGD